MTSRSEARSRGTGERRESTLTPAQFHILVTLADGGRHGYGIMQEVERRTDGATELGPGTLYRSIKQLRARGFIEEVEAPAGGEIPEKGIPGKQRRFYALTREGQAQTLLESRRLTALARWAEEVMVPEGGRP
jgi:DNA-binding PadR family transcriptional regulator